MKGKKLGKGLDYLLGEALGAPPAAEAAASTGSPATQEVPIRQVRANPFQPRKTWEASEIDELAASIREQGLIQPIIVRPAANGYEIVAGERRFRALQKLGRESIPVIVRETDDRKMLEVALVENLHRKDLNPIDKGLAFKALIDKFKLTHEAVSAKLGMDRSTVTNFIRLLDLPERVRDSVSRGTLTMGHARCLVGLSSAGEQLVYAQRVEKDGLSVRDLEKMLQKVKEEKSPAVQGAPLPPTNALLKSQEEKLRRHFETKVKIRMGQGRSAIIVEFYNLDDFERIMERMGMKDA